MSFDKDQTALLQKVVAARSTLYFPFFANTFPLAYHYSRAVHEMNAPKGVSGDASTVLHEWHVAAPINVKRLERPSIFFASSATIESLKRAATRQPQFHLRTALVTEYVPRMFFMRRGVELARLIALTPIRK